MRLQLARPAVGVDRFVGQATTHMAVADQERLQRCEELGVPSGLTGRTPDKGEPERVRSTGSPIQVVREVDEQASEEQDDARDEPRRDTEHEVPPDLRRRVGSGDVIERDEPYDQDEGDGQQVEEASLDGVSYLQAQPSLWGGPQRYRRARVGRPVGSGRALVRLFRLVRPRGQECCEQQSTPAAAP